ncbi:MAG: O-antigen ligase family protein [Chloroflexi bacterium]|nr:O-antigen ligase family protein [Chloroflexota bacterium]
MNPRLQDILRIGIWSGVLLILLTPLVVSEKTLFPYVVGKAIWFRSLVEIVFAQWVLLALVEPRYKPRRSWIVWLFGVYLVVALVSAYLGVSFQRSFWGDFRRMGGVFDLAHWLLFLLVVANLVQNTRHWRWLLNANLGIALVISILGLAQHFNIRLLDALFWYFKPTSRLDITFGNATYVAAYTLVNSLVALGYLARSFHRSPEEEPQPGRRARPRRRVGGSDGGEYLILWRAFWVSTAVLCIWVLTLSGTRGAALGLIAGLLAAGVGYLIWGQERRSRIVVGVGLGALFLLVVSLPLVRSTAPFQALARSNVLLQRFESTLRLGGEDTSVRSRLTVATVGLRAFAQKPAFGWGPENFAVAFDRNATGKDTTIGVQVADQAHNKPVEEMVTKGLVGLTLYLLIVGRVLWVMLAAVRRDPQERALALFLLAAAVGYIVQDLFLFDTPGTLLSFALLMAWAASREDRPASEPAQPARQAAAAAQGPSSSRGRRSRGVARAPANLPGRPGARSPFAMEAPISPVALGLASAAAALAVAFLLFWLNYRPYHAAVVYPVQGSTVKQFVADAQASFEVFPPLATLGRQFLFDTLAEYWERGSRSEDPLVLEQVEREGKAALKSEPQNPRLYLSLAKVYQSASASNPALRSLAQDFIDQARQLAPGLAGVGEATIRQQALQEGYAPALTSLYKNIREEPSRAPLLADLRKDLEAKLQGQIGEEEFRCRWLGKPDLSLEERASLVCGSAAPAP